MLKYFYSILIVFGFNINAIAKDDSYTNIDQIPLSLCRLKMIEGVQYLISAKIQSEFASYFSKLNDETRKIISSAKIKNKPIDEQLSTEKLIDFENNRQKKIVINLQQLIESNRERDLTQIVKLSEVADRIYRFGEIYDKNDSAYDNYIRLMVLRNQYNITNDQNEKQEKNNYQKVCNVDFALNRIGEEPLKIIKSIDQDELSNRLKNLTSKYNIDRVDRKILSATDKLLFDTLQIEKIQPLINSTNYLIDLENLRLLNKVSEMIYAKLKEDLELSGGDSRQYGEKIKNIFSDKNIDPRLSYSYAMLQLIEKANPSQIAKQTKETVKFIESLK